MHKYLVAVDGSENSEMALRTAVKLAEKTGGTVTILTVLNVSALGYNINSASYNNHLENNTDTLRNYLDELVEKFCSDKFQTEKLIRIGNIGNEIIEEAENHDLLFIGSRGLGRVQRTFLGSISTKVIDNVNIPTLVVKNETDFKKILVPIDGSRHSKKALIKANEIGKYFESELVILNVIDDYHLPQMETFDLELAINFSEEAKEKSAEIIEKGDSYIKGYPYEIKNLSLEGDAATTILEVANLENVSMIAMGSQGLGAFSRALIGSVSSEVVRKANVSVLIDR